MSNGKQYLGHFEPRIEILSLDECSLALLEYQDPPETLEKWQEWFRGDLPKEGLSQEVEHALSQGLAEIRDMGIPRLWAPDWTIGLSSAPAASWKRRWWELRWRLSVIRAWD